MHVVLIHVPLHDLDLVLSAYVAYQIARSRRHLPAQGWPAIFRYPDQMQVDLEYGMRAVAIVCHPPQLSLRRAR